MSYIEREALLKDISETVIFSVKGGAELPTAEMRGANKVINRIKSAPAADVVEVRHGHWYFVEYEYFSCSEFGKSYYNGCDSTCEAKEKLRNGEYHNYCPNCGADMRGNESEGEIKND